MNYYFPKFEIQMKQKKICITEIFITNMSHQISDYKITPCEFTAQGHKFKIGVKRLFKDFWYTIINMTNF